MNPSTCVFAIVCVVVFGMVCAWGGGEGSHSYENHPPPPPRRRGAQINMIKGKTKTQKDLKFVKNKYQKFISKWDQKNQVGVKIAAKNIDPDINNLDRVKITVHTYTDPYLDYLPHWVCVCVVNE